MLSKNISLTQDQIEEMIDSNCKEQLKVPVICKYIKFKYNFKTGSNDAMEFLTCISNSKKLEIFTCESISKLVKYKWKKFSIKLLFFLQNCYVLLLIIIIHDHKHRRD